MFSTNTNNAFNAPKRSGVLNELEERGLQAGTNDPLRANSFQSTGVSSSAPASQPVTSVNEQQSWERYKNSFANYLMPEYTPQRAKSIYALSQNALDDVVGTYYNSTLKGPFDRNRATSRARGEDAYMRYISVPGADPVQAQNAMMREYDPQKIIDQTMNEVNDEELLRVVTPLARYSGMEPREYVNSFVKPSLRDRLMNEFVLENTPRSSGEYIFRSALDNSLTGMLANIGMNSQLGSNTHSTFARAGLNNYNASRTENLIAGVGSLLVDAPVFGAFGMGAGSLAGKATSMATKRVAARVLAGRVGSGMTQQYATKIAERAIMNRLSTKILQSSFTQGMTLGTYDLANSVASDILYNSNVDFGRAAGAFGRGFATGGALGVVGTPLRNAARGLTGGRRLAASAGVLSAESAVFTASTEASKMLAGVEIEPIDLLYDFGESAATLGIMKMTHWRPLGGEVKLDGNGRLRPEYRLTRSEQAELRELNINPEEFMSSIERELNLPSYGGGSSDVNVIKENYLRLMSSDNLSASTRAKLLFVVENKLTSTPPVAFDYTVEQRDNNKWYVTTYDAEGRKIECNEFDHSGNAKNYFLVERSNIRRNRIAAYEQELTSGVESQNFLRQAGLYAQEKGISVDEMSEILYRRAQGEQLGERETGIVNDILARSAYDETGMVQLLSNKRRELERKYSLPEGSLLDAVDKAFYRCSDAENRALDEYMAFVQDEVTSLKVGTNGVRSQILTEMGRNSEYRGLSNEEVRNNELATYRANNNVEQGPYSTTGNSHSSMSQTTDGTTSRQTGAGRGIIPVEPIRIPETDSEFVWNYYGNRTTPAELENYREYATRLAERYGHEISFISDEREIPRPQADDVDAVTEYNNQLRALGWVNNGKVYLNLPNLKSVEDVERTVVHEIVGHSGFSKLFGNHLNNFLEEVYSRASGDVLRGINEMKWRYRGFDNYTVVEEYLARLAENTRPSAEERSLLRRFKDFIKGMLIRLNIYTGRNRRITEDELQFLIRQHGRYMQRRVSPGEYRGRLFGDFNSANYPEATYTDRRAYGNWVREGVDNGSFFANTPGFLINEKGLSNYEFLPENKKAEFRQRWNVTEDEVRDVIGGRQYSLPGNEKGNDDVNAGLTNLERRLSRQYDEARRILLSFEVARSNNPRFDADGYIAAEFKREYGVTPDEFRQRFSNFDDYFIFRLTSNYGVLNTPVRRPNVKIYGYGKGSTVTEIPEENDVNRESMFPDGLRRYFNGPLDIVYDNLLLHFHFRNNQPPKRDFGWERQRQRIIESDRERRRRLRNLEFGEEEENLPN